MSLVIGILVDDSTVVLENIERHFNELRQPPKEAAVRGREEIGAAAVVITLVDVVVFSRSRSFKARSAGRSRSLRSSSSSPRYFAVRLVHDHANLGGAVGVALAWKPWTIVEWFGKAFDNLRPGTRRKSFLEPRSWQTRGRILRRNVRAGARDGRPGGRRRGVHPAGRSRRNLRPVGLSDRHADSDRRKRHVRLEQKILNTSDIFANTAVAGAYAASFGGFVSQSNVGQVHIWLKDKRKESTSYWVASSGK